MDPGNILMLLIFFALGILVSGINSIAGGGSTLSLPIMIFLALPPTVANGTNRIGLLTGNISSVVNLHKHGYLNGKIYRQLFAPTLIGALFGLFFLVRLEDRAFQGILSVTICLVVIMSNLKNNFLGKPPEHPPEHATLWGFIGFLLVSIYGCIVQVGVGFVQIFALSRYTGLDLIHVNALKNALTTTFLIVSTLGLACTGKINWGLALALALGSWIGGYIGSKLQQQQGNVFIKRFVGVASIAMAGYLLYDLFK
jgi:hypothetical protein